ncbi:pilus assembly protein [Rhizobium sp. NTR19]|uniref:Pilus assembly protein n=1 Tax=Neorhizobium turbinariae TaxID=2937795 RepID=A0ABT0IXM4_9HYPH|nr:TadE/TadG family type IV pilus assembly protein [Neorhizobium turbinariae]MCK8782491.1 pilus assembly protein [Neorhizobium turbinariae]
MTTRSTARNHLLRLIEDRSGNFGVLTAILAVPLLLSAGMAVDYTTATAKRLNLQALADSAALAGGSTFDGTNESEAKEVAAAYLKAHSEGLPDDNAFDVKMHGQTLEVSLNGSYDNVFMDIVGRTSLRSLSRLQRLAP